MKRRIGRLFKHHTSCTNTGAEKDCACSWRGRYGRVEVTLSKWLDETVDPHSERDGQKALNRLVAAIDAKTFEQRRAPKEVAGLTLTDLIDEWDERHAKAESRTLVSNSLADTLNVLKVGVGRHKLTVLVEDASIIKDWLDEAAKARQWKAATWNKYHAQLYTICKKGTTWKIGKRPWLARNPIAEIERRQERKPQHFKVRVLEPVEDQLFAVVDQLNRVQHGPTKAKLTQEKADQIRARVEAGETQVAVARAFNISTGLCCQIIKGDIWNPKNYTRGTKGDEMERRLIAAFDGGVRRGEMQRIQIKHVNWKLVTRTDKDGQVIKAYLITLPPDLTKGGKRSGEDEVIYVATPRFRQMLDRRRMQLKNEPEAYIFGTEAGDYQADFDRMWAALFDLADLRWGRDEGLVWHSIRHEFISRIAELTKDPVVTKELARHKDMETTELYMKAREDRKLAAVAGLAR